MYTHSCVCVWRGAWQDSCWNTHLHVADKGDIKPAGQQQVKVIYELSGDEGEAAE